MQTLLDKLERIRKELGRDKVFDVIGRLFEGVSIKEYMERAVTAAGADAACRALEGTLTKEQVEALEAKERRIYGDGGDVKASLAAERAKLDREGWRRLLPGYVRRFIEKSAPLLGLGIERRPGRDLRFQAAPARRARLPLEPAGDLPAGPSAAADRPQARAGRGRAVPPPGRAGIRSAAGPRLRTVRRCPPAGAESSSTRRPRCPYLFHLAAVSVVRRADASFPSLARGEIAGTPARRAAAARRRLDRAVPGRVLAVAEGLCRTAGKRVLLRRGGR